MTTSPKDTGTVARPVRARLDKFADVDAFVDGYSQYFFDGGMLLPTRSPREVGARIVLQLEIRGGVVVVRADALVERIRNGPDGSPVGMVLRFETLDDATHAMVHRILSERKQRRTADHPVVPSAPAPQPEVAAPAAAPAPAPAHSAPLSGSDAAGEALDAIASSLDESFDAIFGGSDRSGDHFGSPAATPARAPAPTPAPTPVEAARPPIAPSVQEQLAGPPPRGTMVGMPAFDVAALLERRREVTPVAPEPIVPQTVEAPDSQVDTFSAGFGNRFEADGDDRDQLASGDVLTVDAPPSDSAGAFDDLFAGVSASSPEPAEDSRTSQSLGRLALQRVQRSGSAPDLRLGAEPPRTAARAILKSKTGEMAAIPDESQDATVTSHNDDALDRMLSVEPAPLPSRGSDDVLDDILGDLVSGNPAPPRQAASASTTLAPVQTVAPTGFIGRLLLWLRSLFGG